MPDLKIKRAPAVDSNNRAWIQVYDDINDIIKSVNKKSTDESRTKGTDGADGDVRLFKDNVKRKYFIEGKFKDGWAKRELLFSDNDDASQDESINFSATESYVKPDGTVAFTAVQPGITPSNTNHLATKGYVDGSVTLGGSLDYLTISNQVITRNAIDLAADITGTLPINKGGTNATSFTTGKALEFVNGSIASSSINLGTLLVDIVDTAATAGTGGQHGNLPTGHVCLIEDGGASGNQAKIYNVKSANTRMTISDSSSSGSDFIEFNVADQSLNINRFDTIYHYDDTNANVETSPASGADGMAFVDTSTVTFTVNDQAGSGTYENKVKISAVAANDNTTYTTNASTVSGGANFNLSAANPSSTDTVKFASAGATTVSRTDASTIQISSTDTNTTNINSSESTGGDFVSLVEDADTVRALKKGTGINIEIEGQGDGEDVVKISSTVDTSGLLTNGIVIIEDWNGSEVEETASASGGDKLRFVENDGIEWSISGPTSSVISVTPSLSGYNASNWNNAYTHSQATHAPTNAEQNVQSDWNAGSGDAHILNKPSIPTRTSLGIDTDDAVAFGSITCENGFVVVDTTDESGATAGFKYISDSGVGDRVDIGWGGSYGANMELYSKSHSSRAGEFKLIYGTGGSAGSVYFTHKGASHANKMQLTHNGNLHVKEDVFAYSSSVASDRKLKKNIIDTKYGLKDVLKLRGVDFDWKEKRNKTHDIGVIAQEIQKVIPELVTEIKDLNGNDTHLTVDYAKLVPVLIESIKELKKELDGIRLS